MVEGFDSRAEVVIGRKARSKFEFFMFRGGFEHSPVGKKENMKGNDSPRRNLLRCGQSLERKREEARKKAAVLPKNSIQPRANFRILV